MQREGERQDRQAVWQRGEKTRQAGMQREGERQERQAGRQRGERQAGRQRGERQDRQSEGERQDRQAERGKTLQAGRERKDKACRHRER